MEASTEKLWKSLDYGSMMRKGEIVSGKTFILLNFTMFLHSVEKREIHSHRKKIFRQINSLAKVLVSRNICQKSAKKKFGNLHTGRYQFLFFSCQANVKVSTRLILIRFRLKGIQTCVRFDDFFSWNAFCYLPIEANSPTIPDIFVLFWNKQERY